MAHGTACIGVIFVLQKQKFSQTKDGGRWGYRQVVTKGGNFRKITTIYKEKGQKMLETCF